MSDYVSDKLTATIKSSTIKVVEDSDLSGVDIVQLYNPVNCLRCSSLLSLSKKEEQEWENVTDSLLLRNMSCHYSLGNNLCPASKLRISKHVDVDRVVDLYKDALACGDIKRLAAIVKRIQNKDNHTAQLIMSRIRGLDKLPPVTEPLITEIDRTPLEPAVDDTTTTTELEGPIPEPTIEHVGDTEVVTIPETVAPTVENDDDDFKVPE